MFNLSSHPQEIFEEEDYKLAYEFMLRFEAKEDIDYSWVCTYAESHYQRLQTVAEVIDDKAESIIKIFASGSALLSLGAIINIEKYGLISGVSWGIGILFALLAVIAAGWVRYPKVTYMPPSSGWALDIAEKHGDKSEVTFVTQWHLASEGLRIGTARKAVLL